MQTRTCLHRDTKIQKRRVLKIYANVEMVMFLFFYNKIVKGYDHGMSCNV